MSLGQTLVQTFDEQQAMMTCVLLCCGCTCHDGNVHQDKQAGQPVSGKQRGGVQKRPLLQVQHHGRHASFKTSDSKAAKRVCFNEGSKGSSHAEPPGDDGARRDRN
eukprot:4034968-Pleurochrysis_carterae.AAC.1